MRFCGGCGAPLPVGSAVAGVSDAGAAHRRHLTVMFVDIVQSTRLAETLDPEDFRDILRRYQRACVRAIERFEGYTARYAGDGLVAYFGYPRAREDSPQCSVHAGLGILDELAGLNGWLRDEHDVALRVRIGIHTGVVVAEELGAGLAREQLGIVGDTPHIAARLESIAAPDTVVISGVTHDLVERYFETESLGETDLRGVSQPMVVHRVLRPTGAVARLEVVGPRRLTPLVGRDPELAQLADAWQRAKAGRSAVVHVTGEAGIGKSRIVRELVERLGPQIGSAQIWQCSAHHQSTTLHPVIRFLEQFLLLDGAETPDRQLEILSHAARDAGLDPAETVALLADLLSVPGAGGEGRSPLTPRDARAATLQILEALLVTSPARHPVVLVVEDLHWADPTTVELLGRIIDTLPSAPVLCILTFRPQFEAPWGDSRAVSEVALGPLSSENVRALAAWASPTTLDPAVVDWVDSAADGVPLFVEETLKMLEHDQAQRAGGSGPALAVVPSTLRGLLTERLDRLPDLGELIDVAAVLGREFDRGLLEALWRSDAPELEPALVALAAQDVLRPVQGSTTRCEFSHALLQEAAYERILRRDRQALHGRVASSLVAGGATMAERQPEVVAHHWSCAAQPAKAVQYWRAAGIRALERAAFLEASHDFRRGLEALDAVVADPGDHVTRVDFLTHLGASLQAGHGYAAEGVDEAYAKARSACERAGDDELLTPVIRGQWLYRLLRSEYGAARELADEMLALGAGAGDGEAGLAEGHLYRGFVDMYLADFEQAREHLEEAFTRYRRRGGSDHVYEAQGDTGVMALAYQALVLWNLGYSDRSRSRSDLSLELAERQGGPVTRAQAWGMRSILHLTRGESVELSYWVDKTLKVSVDSNIGYWRAVSATLSAWQQGRSGELEAGIARLEASLDAYLRSGSRLSLPHFCIYLADLRLAAGDSAGALDILRLGEQHIESTDEGFAESELYRFKGRVLTAGVRPDLEGATVAYERAVSAARRQNARLLELRALTRLAVHQGRTGQERTALAGVAALCEWFTVASDLPDVKRARMLLAQGSRAR
ncbi:MAG TPA: AAA family ATPase [Solirubrobacteraceae bacterium]|nr:AAA family ATPase [Solirubrobacteraceae bacterium]